ncbi:F0F1 ATP synthase subunit delta [Oscillatoriales cyanobacterium LEGE 11467]|uniref:ATP synthase subunit delta n=1 Tax=Zarconia navalis LEGE 11467 TaxID=1828826 RepID=A0A928W0K5_9CYAN|nr:ATP synthase F1 subunit delta [Zarconia navalis]MBE9042287.1 F0F1 ATP synthase subunit delta [Zarconia navalis LEGE 11467]
MRSGAMGAQIADPYAKALMSIADDRDLADRIGRDMADLQQLLQESEDLEAFLDNPIIAPDDKKAVLRRVAESEIDPTTLNFLMLLVDRGRILFLDEVCRRYRSLLRERNQTVLAEVTSTVELTGSQRDAIESKVKDLTGAREVEIETQIDPDIIGGVIIKVGSQVLDASLRGQLRRLAVNLS